jgi:MobA/MobL family
MAHLCILTNASGGRGNPYNPHKSRSPPSPFATLEMAIYHFSVQIIGRSSGRSVIAAAAYRAGEILLDKRTGITHDYTRKKGVYETQILLPETAPSWMKDRSQLWNEVERIEKRCDAQLAREINLAIPRELDHEQKRELVYGFVQDEFVARGMIADVALHDLNSENPHAHLLLTKRVVILDGFGNKDRNWDQKSVLQEHRSSWAEHANRALASAGYTDRIDHRSLKDQGIERLPQIHLGPQVKEMDLKGRSTDRADEYRRIEAANLHQAKLLQELRKIEAELLLLDEIEATESQDSVPTAIEELPDPELPLSILEEYQIQRARLAAQERSAQENLEALEQKGQRSLFNPFGVPGMELQVAAAAVRLYQADRAALEIAIRRLEDSEADRSSESGDGGQPLEPLTQQEILSPMSDEPISTPVMTSPAVIPDRRPEVQAFLSELQSRLNRAARQILDDIGTSSGSGKRFAEVGSYRIQEQDGELWIQVSGVSDASLRSILQKGDLVRGIKKSDLENLEENVRRVRAVLQGQGYPMRGQRGRGQDWER